MVAGVRPHQWRPATARRNVAHGQSPVAKLPVERAGESLVRKTCDHGKLRGGLTWAPFTSEEKHKIIAAINIAPIPTPALSARPPLLIFRGTPSACKKFAKRRWKIASPPPGLNVGGCRLLCLAKELEENYADKPKLYGQAPVDASVLSAHAPSSPLVPREPESESLFSYALVRFLEELLALRVGRARASSPSSSERELSSHDCRFLDSACALAW